MSLKRIAASTPRMSTGCSVTSAARSGVLQSSRKLTFSRTARYSGRYRPAWRINQIGVLSTGLRKHASMNRCAMRRRVSRSAGDLLQLEDRLAALEDADRAARLRDGDGDRLGLDGDRRGGGVPGPEPERQLDVLLADLQIPAGGE